MGFSGVLTASQAIPLTTRRWRVHGTPRHYLAIFSAYLFDPRSMTPSARKFGARPRGMVRSRSRVAGCLSRVCSELLPAVVWLGMTLEFEKLVTATPQLVSHSRRCWCHHGHRFFLLTLVAAKACKRGVCLELNNSCCLCLRVRLLLGNDHHYLHVVLVRNETADAPLFSPPSTRSPRLFLPQ